MLLEDSPEDSGDESPGQLVCWELDGAAGCLNPAVLNQSRELRGTTVMDRGMILSIGGTSQCALKAPQTIWGSRQNTFSFYMLIACLTSLKVCVGGKVHEYLIRVKPETYRLITHRDIWVSSWPTSLGLKKA